MASQVKTLLERNKEVAAASWRSMPLYKEIQDRIAAAGKEIMDPRPIIVTCADARADPSMYFGLSQGEIPTLRNAGGRVTEDILRSLEFVSTFIRLNLVIVIHHTDCGVLLLTEDHVRKQLSSRAPEHAHEIEDKSWLSTHDIGINQSVLDDTNALKAWHFLPKDAFVAGYVFDIKTGLLREVVPPSR